MHSGLILRNIFVAYALKSYKFRLFIFSDIMPHAVLYSYLSKYKKILGITLLLATINQAFSLLDPQFFRLIIDRYASHPECILPSFCARRSAFPCGGVGAAFVSRVRKIFRTIIQTSFRFASGLDCTLIRLRTLFSPVRYF